MSALLSAVFAAVLLAANTPLSTLSGTWDISRTTGTHQLQLRLTFDGSVNTIRISDDSMTFNAAQLGLSNAQIDGPPADTRFGLQREAGTFRFTGVLGHGSGSGSATFTPSQAFYTGLASRGLELRDTRDVMTAATVDLTLAYVDSIHGAGYPGLPFDDMIAFRALHVTPGSIAQLESMFRNLSADQVISTTALRITPAYVNELHSLGLQHVSAEQAVEFKSLQITKAYVDELARMGFSRLTPEQIVEFRAMRIDAAYIKHLADHGLKNLTAEQVVQLKASGL